MKQKIYSNFLLCLFGILVFALLGVSGVWAADLSSPSFIVKDPIVGTGGGYFSSGSFQMFGSGDGLLTGYNSSTSFIGEYGFLYFPVTIPVVPPTPTPGGGGAAGLTYPALPPELCAKTADFNCDGYVDLLDLSILLYYTDKSGSAIVPYDLSQDGKVDLMDISILFYYWDFHKAI